MKRPRQSNSHSLTCTLTTLHGLHLAHDFSRIGESDYWVVELHRPLLCVDDFNRGLDMELTQANDQVFWSGPLARLSASTQRVPLMDYAYHVFETHVIAVRTDLNRVHKIYLQLDCTTEGEATLQPDLTLSWFGRTFPDRFKPLPFFPPDVDVTQYGLKLDLRVIPQRTPLWFKHRGPMTGTKAYMYVGFWVPTKQEDPNWSVDKKPTFTPEELARMHLGTVSEEPSLVVYLTLYPDRCVELSGLCQAPDPYPLGWGASPDALVRDPSYGWDQMPEWAPKFYRHEDWDPTLGVIEIKTTSTSSLELKGYYFPQVYMEMIATKRLWCDLVRYRPGAAPKVRIYRVHRHPEVEATLAKLLRYALERADRLQDVVREPPFVKVRAMFETFATTVPYVEHEANARVVERIAAYQTAKEGGRPVGGKRTRLDLSAALDAGPMMQALRKEQWAEALELLSSHADQCARVKEWLRERMKNGHKG